MLHFPCNDYQINDKHQRQRNQGGFDEGIGVPYGLIGWQAVAVVIHGNYNIFEHSVSEQIADYRRNQRYDHRHRKVMADELALSVAGSPQCTDGF